MSEIMGLSHKESNQLILNGRWKDLDRFLEEENMERSTDIDNLLNNLSKKVQHIGKKDQKNFELINDQINEDSERIIGIRKNHIHAEQIQNDFLMKQEQTNQNFIKQQLDKRDQLIRNKTNLLDQSISDISKQYHEGHLKILSEGEQLYKEFKEIKNCLLSKLQEGKQFHKQEIKNIHANAGIEFEEIKNLMSQFESTRKEEQIKMKYMIEELNEELNSCVEKEEKAGCIVYDCLLSLIEDSYSKIHEVSLLK